MTLEGNGAIIAPVLPCLSVRQPMATSLGAPVDKQRFAQKKENALSVGRCNS
jgi:hypothetical protein